MAGFQSNPTDRVSTSNSMVSNPGWSDKVTTIADPLVSTAGSIAGMAAKVPTTVAQNATDISNNALKDTSALAKKWSVGKIGGASNLNNVSSVLGDTNKMLDAMGNFKQTNYQNNLAAGNLPKMFSTQSGQVVPEEQTLDFNNIPYLLKRYGNNYNL
jgi:ATP/maltotriose-dependent transcriptional regulator MalT